MSRLATFVRQPGGGSLGTPAVNAEFYVAANGSDSNAGTRNAPFLTPGAALAAISNVGTRVHLRRGDIFSITTQLTPPISGAVMAPIYVGAYGDANKAKPIISGLLSVKGSTGDWTEVGSDGTTPQASTNRWRRTTQAAKSQASLYFNGALGNAMDTSPANVTATNDWRHNGTDLWVFSVGNPATAFTTLELSNVDRLFGCNGKSHVIVEDIDFNGGYTIGAVDTGDGSNIRFRNLETTLCARSAFLIRSNGAVIENCKAHDLGFSTGLGEHGYAVAGPALGVLIRDCLAYNCKEDGLQLRNTTPLLSTFAKVYWIGGAIHSCGENAIDCKRGSLHVIGAYLECSAQHTITLQGEFNTLTIEDSILHHRGASMCIFAQEGSYVGSSGNTSFPGTRVISRRNFYSTINSECVELNSAGVPDDCIFEADTMNGVATGSNGIFTVRSGINHVMRQCYIRNRGSGQAFKRRISGSTAVHFASMESNIFSCAGNEQPWDNDGGLFTVSSALKNVFRKTTNTSTMLRTHSVIYSGTQITDGTLTAAVANFGGAGSIATITDLSPSRACAITRSGQTCTVTLTGHELTAGQKAAVFNATETAYNRPFFVKSVIDANTFTYDLPEGVALPATPATGSPVVLELRIINAPPSGVDNGADQTAVVMDNSLDAFPNPNRPFGPLAAKRAA